MGKEIFIALRSAFNYDAEKVSKETGLKCLDKSKTQQNQKEESDINTIVRRFGLTGQLPDNVRMPQYGDFRGIKDYQSALNSVQAANDAFAAMPAHIRTRFDNDPEQFVAFCLDKRNLDEAIKLGLVKEPAVKTAGSPAAEPVVKAAEAAK